MLSDVIKIRERSQDARAKTLYWLRNHIEGLGAESQVRVVRELINDLRKAIQEYQRLPKVVDPIRKIVPPVPAKQLEHKR